MRTNRRINRETMKEKIEQQKEKMLREEDEKQFYATLARLDIGSKN